MPTIDKRQTRPASRAGLSPWSVEPEVPPARERLTELLGEAIALAGEINAEMASLRPVLVREPSTETAYVAAMHRLEAAKQTAADVRAALQRLDDGSYGWCVTCLEPIPEGRLALRPQAAHCVTCS